MSTEATEVVLAGQLGFGRLLMSLQLPLLLPGPPNRVLLLPTSTLGAGMGTSGFW